MNQLIPKIGLRSATILVVSVIIGSGVFKKIAPMASMLGSPILVIVCWVIAGFISLIGALITAEIAGIYPSSGGEYYYFRKVFGDFFAFIFGWANFVVMKTASIAALAYIFAQSFVGLLHLDGDSSLYLVDFTIKLIASLLILILSFINARGIIFAERLGNLLTFFLLVAILTFIVVGFRSDIGSINNFFNTQPNINTHNNYGIIKAMMVASLGAFWGYEGWNHIGFIGEEIKNPSKNLPFALIIGTLIVIIVYVLLNVCFLYLRPISFYVELNNDPNKIAAVEVSKQIFGYAGSIFIGVLILVTTLNSTNSTILMSSRILYSMAKDKVFFKKSSIIHEKYKTPNHAIFIQAVWAVVLVWSGSFDQLTDMLVFASFIFYGATAVAVIKLRLTNPELPRRFKIIAYPFLPVFFIFFCLLLLIFTILNQPKEAFIGCILMMSGIPFYLFWRRK